MSNQVGELANTAWSGTSTLTMETTRQNEQVDTVLRFLNDLNEQCTVTLYVTHGADTGRNYVQQSAQKTVAADSIDGALVTEPWERFFVDVTPQNDPTSGAIYLYQVGGD